MPKDVAFRQSRGERTYEAVARAVSRDYFHNLRRDPGRFRAIGLDDQSIFPERHNYRPSGRGEARQRREAHIDGERRDPGQGAKQNRESTRPRNQHLLPDGLDLKMARGKAEAALEQCDYTAAEPLLKSVVEKNPNNYQAWFDLGFLYNAQNKPLRSITSFNPAITVTDDSSSTSCA